MRVLRCSDAVTISDDVFRQLSSATSGGPVCPQLQRLTWTFSYGWEHMQRFLSPYLVSVIFLGENETKRTTDPALVNTFSLLPTTYLEELEFKHLFPRSAPIHPVFSEVVQRLNTCFRRLTIWSSLSDAAWAHLASLPNLERLWITDTPSTEIWKSTAHENIFPALKHISINADNARQHWSFLFSSLQSSPRQRVMIVMGPRAQGVDVPRQVTTAILETKLQRNINTLAFIGSDHNFLTFISHLRPFSSLRNLRCDTRCGGVGRCTFPLGDSDIEQLASRLPRLVVLWLGHGCKYSTSITTIKSMVSLSTHCLSLEELHLPCDLTNISKDVKTESGEPNPKLGIRSSSRLQSLAFQWVTAPPWDDIEALKILASALNNLFPRLLRPVGSEIGDTWKAAFDVMTDF